MHLNPDSDGFMGGARNGYMLIVGLILRPVLIILGFIVALLVITPVTMFFNQIFFQIFINSMVGSLMGLITMLAMIFIYFGTMIFLFHSIFGFIHKVSDKLLRWMGGGGEQLGDHSEQMGNAGKTFAAAAAGGAIGSSINQGVQGISQGRAARQQFEGNKSDAISRAQSAAGSANDAGGKAASSMAVARSNPDNVPDQMQAVTDLAGEASSKQAAADNMAAVAHKYGSSMSPEQKKQFQQQATSLAKEAEIARGGAQGIIDGMGQRGEATGNPDMLRGARDAQNFLDRATNAPKPEGADYTAKATGFHEAAKRADGNAPPPPPPPPPGGPENNP